MDRQQMDRIVPFAYSLVVIICALWIHVAIVPVAIIGALLVAVYYSVLRPKAIGRSKGPGSTGSKER